MRHYGFYDEPSDPKIQNDWGDMLNLNQGQLSPDAIMQAHFQQNVAVELPPAGSPYKRRQEKQKEEYSYQEGVIASYCPDPTVKQDAEPLFPKPEKSLHKEKSLPSSIGMKRPESIKISSGASRRESQALSQRASHKPSHGASPSKSQSQSQSNVHTN